MAVYQNVGSEWENDGPDSTEQQTAIEHLANGGYVVAWVDGNDGQNNIRAQVFNPNGTPNGSEFVVNSPTPPEDYHVKFNVDIQLLDNGNFAIAWDQTFAGSNGNGILARVFTPAGTPIGNEFLAGTYSNDTLPGGLRPNIVASGGGDFWMLSTSQIPYGSNEIFAQKFGSDGTLLAGRVQLTNSGDGAADHAITTRLANGNIAMAWVEYAGDVAGTLSIVEQVFNGDLVAISGKQTLQALSAYNGDPEFSIAATQAGGFAVGWSRYEGDGSGGPTAELLQMFNAVGEPVAPATVIERNDGSGSTSVGLAALADGNLVMTWTPNSEGNVHGQIFDSSGVRAGGIFELTDDGQRNIVVTGTTIGGFAVSFLGGSAESSDHWSVKSQVFGVAAAQGTSGDDVIILRQDDPDGHVISGLDGSDHIAGNNGANYLQGGNGDDVLSGGAGIDTLKGQADNDRLDGGAGADKLFGGAGDDTYFVDDAGDRAYETTAGGVDDGGFDIVFASATFTLGSFVENLSLTGLATISGTGNEGDNLIVGNAGINTLKSMGGNDTVQGAGGADLIYGGDGADSVDGGAGADRMYGGAGDDTYDVDNTGDRAYEDTIAGVDDGGLDIVNASVTFTLGAFIETLVLTGADAINGTGNSGSNSLNGNYAANTLRGLGGDDRLDGLGGVDKMYGGSGNDTYFADNAGDRAYEYVTAGVDDGGHDLVVSSVSFALGAFVEDLTFINSAGSTIGTGNTLGNQLTGDGSYNVLKGLAGNDTLDEGSGGNDRLYGGAGNDTYVLHVAARVYEDTIAGVDDGGIDTVVASYSYTLGNFVENLTLADAAVTGNGNGLNNGLQGTAVNNVLDGKAGNDTLFGGGGNDYLTGGTGVDDFMFAHFGAANGIDHVKDFVSGVDRLAFTAADFGWNAGHVLQASELSLTGTAVGPGAQFVYNVATHQLYWDANGSAAGGLSSLAVFDNAATPHTGDFVFS